MSLKETLDAIWDSPGVMFPKHRCWFHHEKFGYEITDGLWVSAGRPVGAVRPKKGRLGYSPHFPKWYGIAIAIRRYHSRSPSRDGVRLI